MAPPQPTTENRPARGRDGVAGKLRSRGGVQAQSQTLYEKESFRGDIVTLLSQQPSGRLVIPALRDALDRIRDLERRMAAVEGERSGFVDLDADA